MKKLMSTLLAIAFVMTSAASGLAASAKCTVTSIEENKVILDCGSKADKFEAGSQVKIKSAKRKAIEGC
ncbi:MAG: hypothetical protein KQH63_02570 [Desulfobulbaceae bacterium]|nr:hypothetical protein [Desulfobulbaceae bacterium]